MNSGASFGSTINGSYIYIWRFRVLLPNVASPTSFGIHQLLDQYVNAFGYKLKFLHLALLCYIVWRFWECFTFQGADATFSPLKNFFAYRLSPFTSGCVYIAYGYYIVRILANSSTNVCYPDCWRDSVIGRVCLVCWYSFLFGILVQDVSNIFIYILFIFIIYYFRLA